MQRPRSTAILNDNERRNCQRLGISTKGCPNLGLVDGYPVCLVDARANSLSKVSGRGIAVVQAVREHKSTIPADCTRGHDKEAF